MKINARYRYAIIGSIICSIAFGLYYLTSKPSKQSSFSVSSLLKEKNLVPVVVIGSGPAGLSAALFTARANFKTIVIAGQQEGGQLMEAAYVENWPSKKKMSGSDMMRDLKEQAEQFGAKVITAYVDYVDFSTFPFTLHLNTGEILKALSVIVATGGSQRTLPIPGVKEYWGKGIGVCTICDAPFDKGKEVVVIGGGDAACDKALQLAAFAKQVTMLVRDKEMRAADIVQGYVKNTKNIAVRCDVAVEKIIGANGRVSALELRDAQSGKNETMPIQSVYFALGFDPNSQLFKGLLQLNKNGYVVLHENIQKTSVDGVFAAGNIEDPLYQKASVAAGAGARAGLDAIQFLQEKGFTPTVAEALKNVLYVEHKNCKNGILTPSTQEELQKIFAEHDTLIIDFYARTCPVCKMLAPYFQQACAQMGESVTFASFDIQNSSEIVKQFNIESTPTLIFLKSGKEVARSIALRSLKDIVDFVQKNKK